MNSILATIADQTVLIQPKDFSTGSRGFYGQSKLAVDGKVYQTSVTMVEIGSKPIKAKAK